MTRSPIKSLRANLRSNLWMTALLAAVAACAGADAPDPLGTRAEDDLSSIQRKPHARACAGPTQPGQAACHARRQVDALNHALAAATPSGLGPADFKSAYNLPASGGAGMTIAIVDAQDNPTAEADLNVYRKAYGLPACTTANGCFKKVNQDGNASPLPKADGGWAEEIALDLDMASAVCPGCKILLVESNTASMDDLGKAVNTAVALGATVVSNSYGGAEDATQAQSDELYFKHPGVLITVSSGDSGYGTEYPASSQYVLAVGGTSLVKSASNPRGWTEGAWSSGGSGCSAYTAKPGWQKDAGCAKRMVADVAAVGDPSTGVAVYTTTVAAGDAKGWLVFGGTSASSPIVAGIFALTGKGSVSPGFPYGNVAAFYDVTAGSNGTCPTSYWCKAGAGYDGPTGVGAPNGAAIQAAGGAQTPNDFSIALGSSAGTVAQGASLSVALASAVVSGSAETITFSLSGLPAGATAAFQPGAVPAGSAATLAISAGAAAAGSYGLTITASAASAVHQATYALTISGGSAPASDFALSLSPASASVAQGGSAVVTVTTKVAAGSAETVQLSVTGVPAGATATFSPTSLLAGGTAKLTLASGTAAAGTYSLTISGAAPSANHAASFSLAVTPSGGGTCTHAACSTGAKLKAACDPCVAKVCKVDGYCCKTAWDSTCVAEVQTICGQSCNAGTGDPGTGTPPVGSTCAHPVCNAGKKLDAACDSCAAQVCAADSYCCASSWDGVCVSEVATVCGVSCN